jgi:hypothetical protein
MVILGKGLVLIPNSAPTVSIATTSATTLPAPASLTLSYKAADTDGGVKKVELLQNGAVVKTVTLATPAASTSGSFALTGLPLGSYSFVPRVTDNLGSVKLGSALKINVGWDYALSLTGADNWYGGLFVWYRLPAGKTGTAQLLNATGTVLLKSIALPSGSTNRRFTSLSGKPAGTYLVRLLVDGNTVASQKVVKK